MAIIQGNAKSSGGAAGFYSFPLEQSLRFNDGDTPYLTWTPATAGDRKTWTFSFWVKRATIGQLHSIFSATNASGVTYIGFYNDTLRFLWNGGGANASDTTMVFRDPSAWYHIVVVWDTVSGGQGHKVYVNGESVTVSIPSPTINTETGIGDTVAQKISSYVNLYYMDGYLAEVNFLNGIAATADDFGELKNGVWIPKEYTGAYDSAAQVTAGNLNGFRLSFADDAEVEAFNTVLYRGNGGTQSVTGMGFQPDLVWIKARSDSYHHMLTDSVRGAGTRLSSSQTAAESADANAVDSFDADGFTVDSGSSINNNSDTYVAWGWKAGDSNVSNTDGSTTSTVRVNQTYGFSVVSYVGMGSSGGSVGHGLGATPNFIIQKNRDAVENWRVYHSSLPTGYYLNLSTTGAQALATSVWSSAPDSTVFNVGNDASVSGSGNNIIAYCWAEKAGYSKFGSYTGTGASGNAVTGLGFTPAWLLVRKTDGAGNWRIFDNTRDTDGTITKTLDAENSNAESDASTNEIVFDSDGFTVNGTAGSVNGNTNNFIYAAFADTREAAFWLDQSGNDNDWQPVNLDHNDTVADSPTDNFCTLNPLFTGNGAQLADGNLRVTLQNGTAGWTSCATTMALPETGKYYAEFTVVNYINGYMGLGFYLDGQTQLQGNTSSTGANDANWWSQYGHTTDWYNGGSATSGAETWSSGTLMLAHDADTGKVWWGRNGSWFNSGNPSTGANAPFTITRNGRNLYMVVEGYNGVIWEANFGQQPFKYDPPA